MISTSALYKTIISGSHRFEVRVDIGTTSYGMDTLTSLRTSRSAFGSGSPALGLAPAGEISLSLEALGGPGRYVIHMFDADGMYFGVNEVPLEAGYTLRFRRQDYGCVLDITNKDGKPVDSLDVFGAMWAGDGGDDLEDSGEIDG